MKKIIAILLIMIMGLSLFSCFGPTVSTTRIYGSTIKKTSTTESVGTTPTTRPTTGTTTGTTGNNEEGDDLLGTIISLVIVGVVLIAVAVFCIIKKEKVGKLFRSLKSETKKVVWMPWDQVRKNSIVVIIVVVIVAIVIGVLDFALSQGIINLGTFFKK